MAGLRIIGGTLKGRRIQPPAWEGLRPSSDRLRETLFNVLAPRIDGARVLDGYAGTGAVGIEALSRGAAHVTFVEQDPRAVKLIARNLAHCGLAHAADRAFEPEPNRASDVQPYAIIRAAFAASAVRLAGTAFDIVFLDPPYGAAPLQAALEAAEPLVGADTLLVLEHARRDATPASLGSLARMRELPSGDSALAFYARSSGGDGGSGEEAFTAEKRS